MRLLLDTHIWIWSVSEPSRLSPSVAAQIRDQRNELWLSPISVWEIIVLAAKNRLQLEESPVSWAKKALRSLPLQEAVISHDVAMATHELQLTLRDPADRFLVATAKVLELTLVTADDRLKRATDCKILLNR